MEFSRIEIITSMDKVNALIEKLGEKTFMKKLAKLGVSGLTVSNVIGCGVQRGTYEFEDDSDVTVRLLPKSMLMIVCETQFVDELIQIMEKELYTGHVGDGKIFVSDVKNIVRVRTGEQGLEALKPSKLDSK